MVVVAAGSTTFAKEMAIRKRISNIFNKREEDFSSRREYNDYLEEVEDMIVNMVEGVDVPAIEARISQYQKENSEQIMNAQARKAEEYAAALAASKGQPVHTDFDATGGQSSQGAIGAGGNYAPAVAGGAIAQPIPIGSGHEMLGYQFDDEEMMKLKAERGGKAGGWSIELSKKRALEEAFGSIWI
ncbi:uncharacterized protein LOC141712468 [Apium graveolens]|uniref:uncharacterized protein LOC141712468 n=1 Tax=Apium graveolens TaxID=4045 RepID=UPI003D7BA3F3